MFKSWDDIAQHIFDTYPDATDPRLNQEHWDLPCDSEKCGGIVRGFHVSDNGMEVQPTRYGNRHETKPNGFKAFYFECPVCHEYKIWLGYWVRIKLSTPEGEEQRSENRFFRLASLPMEGEDLPVLPDEPPSVRIAYTQAVRAMNANAYMPAAVMFRRALQVLLRDVLGVKAPSKKLSEELKAAVGMKYDGVTLTDEFFKDAKILQKAGDQGAHPDEDPDLLDFTEQDARDLQFIFRRLAVEMFEVPQAIRRVRENVSTNRKITPPSK